MKRKLQMKRKLTDEEDVATDDQHLSTPPPAKRSHKPVVKTGTTLQLTPDFLKSPVLQQRVQRFGITPTAFASSMEVVIDGQGGDTSEVKFILKTLGRIYICFR